MGEPNPPQPPHKIRKNFSNQRSLNQRPRYWATWATAQGSAAQGASQAQVHITFSRRVSYKNHFFLTQTLPISLNSSLSNPRSQIKRLSQFRRRLKSLALSNPRSQISHSRSRRLKTLAARFQICPLSTNRK